MHGVYSFTAYNDGGFPKAGVIRDLEDRKGKPRRLVLGDEIDEVPSLLPEIDDLIAAMDENATGREAAG